MNENLGFLTWYSIGEQLVSSKKLKEIFQQFQIDYKFMPKRVRTPDAFRRATSFKQKIKAQQSGIFLKYSTTEVTSNKEEVVRHIVCEKVDTKGKRLAYDSEAAVLVLDRELELMKWEGNDGIALTLAQHAEHEFTMFRTHFNGQMMRYVAQKILNTMSPVPVRPSGGVYFVPVQFEMELNRLTSFACALEVGEAYAVPLGNEKANISLIENKFDTYINEVKNSLKKGLADELTKGQIKDDIMIAKRLLKSVNDYTHILSESTLMSFQTEFSYIQNSITLLEERYFKRK